MVSPDPLKPGWIGVDLDGTLAEYHGWRGPLYIGPVIEPMKERILDWTRHGIEVRIFTARVSSKDKKERLAAGRAIQDWLAENGMPILEVTCTKDYNMIQLWDDRAVQVKENTGEPVV